ncbi:MAG TPA: aminotransferase class III-fold pyridoxal phosphate-dependent enzyme [Aliidongia sp.]|nr:aminotransferase class III-fold pyridoxal phosphate-dependent enzyme [Aliidongia sp.]
MSWDLPIDRALRARAEAVLPNGMYGHQSVRLLPDEYPQFFMRAEDAYLWDVDGHRYIDYMCGYGPNLLGYHHAAIDAAYTAQLARGDALTGPSAVMVELAELFVSMVGHAAWAMFCKNGTDATSMAMVTARAHTGRSKILLAKGAYHGAAPWCTPLKAGVTEEDRANQIFYEYNDVSSLETAVQRAGDDLAAIFASPFKHDAFIPQQLVDPAYARRARELCDQTGALLIVDEVRAGFRLARDSSWSLVGVEPDLSCWGKSIANGHPLSALLGSEKARAAAGSIYVTGSYWFAAAAMAASVATLKLLRDSDYLERTIHLADMLRQGLGEVAARHGIGFTQTGPAQMPLFFFEGDPDFRKAYHWCAELLKRGVYMHPWHNMFICAAMTEADIAKTVEAADAAFASLAANQASLGPNEKLQALFAARG